MTLIKGFSYVLMYLALAILFVAFGLAPKELNAITACWMALGLCIAFLSGLMNPRN